MCMGAPSLTYRVHEWLADHCKWIQYPNISTDRAPLFKNQMPLPTRIFLVVIGVALIGACFVATFFLALFFWAILTG